MKEWIMEKKSYLLFSFVGILIASYLFLIKDDNDTNIQKEKANWETNFEKQEDKKESEETAPVSMIIDVKGAVQKPGVYHVKTGERIVDVINRAGGFTEKADQSTVNLAMRVEDEMVIYIPTIGEVVTNVHTNSTTVTGGGAGSGAAGGSGKGDTVNLNKADVNQLQTLPGIGPAKAAAIIDHRDTNGPFKSIEGLKDVTGIGEKTFEKLKDKISVK